MDRILFQIFKFILNISLKKHGENTDIPPVRIYVNKIESSITFKIKSKYFLEFLTPGTIKLLGRTKSNIIEDKSYKNVPHSEITEVALVHDNIANNNYQRYSRVLHIFVPNKLLGQLLDIPPTNFIFSKTFNFKIIFLF